MKHVIFAILLGSGILFAGQRQAAQQPAADSDPNNGPAAVRTHQPAQEPAPNSVPNNGPAAEATSNPRPSPMAEASGLGSKITVPAETEIPIRLSSTISSASAFAGQHFYGKTFYPITVNDQIVIPVGTYVKGTITEVKRQGRVHGSALIRLRCDSLTFPTGTTVQLASELSGLGGNGQQKLDRKGEPAVKDASKKTEAEDIRTIAATTSSGILVGAIATGTRLGAGMGALAGGLGGLAAVMATRRKEIVLSPGTDLSFQLTRPLVLNRRDVFSGSDSTGEP
ncbi:MAG: hypothetical protein ACM3NO_01560 [Deltaproteobacteria bacterium]